MWRRAFVAGAVLIGLGLVLLYVAGRGWVVADEPAGQASGGPIDRALLEQRSEAQLSAAAGVGLAPAKQILFGDLHVHSTFSFDAFQMSLPMAGGDGAHPVADACDYARHCAGLDFWSINDHDITLTPRRWAETVESIRQCNAVAGSSERPDMVSFVGWEWTQVGTTPENHYGHKNVVLRGLTDDDVPTRPISAGTPPGMDGAGELVRPNPFVLGAFALYAHDTGGPELAHYLDETAGTGTCPTGVPVRELPADCFEIAPTPHDLFGKLDEWGMDSLVIPHGTTWGFYTPPGSSWNKQLTREQHDPKRQRLVEVYSGHGNSEEYRDYREVILAADGSRTCPAPSPGYLPSCWRAGELIEGRCLATGADAPECAARAEKTRQYFVDANFNGGAAVVSGTRVADWQLAGQCTDCFLPAFNYRPRSSVQYMMALGGPTPETDPLRFRFGFLSASDNHSARPGTGYKPVARTEFTETRFGNFIHTPLGGERSNEPSAEPVPPRPAREIGVPFSVWETERQASFFLNGGLTAVHSPGRDRDSIFHALERREVYGTSGPRILLWFDLLNAPGGAPQPMGSEVALAEAPIFQVRAVGSFVQKPGCPADSLAALGPDRLERLCQGECYRPSDRRRVISRIEVVRIRPQITSGEDVGPLIEDPWKIFTCPGDPAGCQIAFSDAEHPRSGRDALYYVRAIEGPSPTVGADPLHCEFDASGRCVSVDPCYGRPADDECLADAEHRAWSSPIFVDHPRG